MGAGYAGGIYISDSSQIADDVVVASDLGIPTAKGGLISYSTNPAELSVGANDYVLTADSTQTTGIKWANPVVVTAGGSPIEIIPWELTSIQGTWVGAVDTTYFASNYFNNSTSAQNDEFSFQAFLMEGTWSFKIIGQEWGNGAISTIAIDASDVGTMDWYAGASSCIVSRTINNIAVATSGLKTITVKLATRNGSSSGWAMHFSTIQLTRTA